MALCTQTVEPLPTQSVGTCAQTVAPHTDSRPRSRKVDADLRAKALVPHRDTGLFDFALKGAAGAARAADRGELTSAAMAATENLDTSTLFLSQEKKAEDAHPRAASKIGGHPCRATAALEHAAEVLQRSRSLAMAQIAVQSSGSNTVRRETTDDRFESPHAGARA